ncbi:hypothetical protein K439DRAFT_1615141 [Ramaria rubella]|nr:hypothetical protein K439DRAFT_1615141 [Ramaria rubella]
MTRPIFQAVDSDMDGDVKTNINEAGLNDSDSSSQNNSDDTDLTVTTGKATGYEHHRAQEACVNSLQTEVVAAMRQMAMLLNEGPADGHMAKIVKGPASSEPLQAMVCSEVDMARLTNIRQLGVKFVIMYLIWISNTSMSFRTKLNSNYSPEDHFRVSLEWKQQGEQADLCVAFPLEFHTDFKHDFIHTTFKAGMDAQCSTMASHIRRLGARLFDCPIESFANAAWRYENCCVRIGWTQNVNDTTFYNPFAPILYHNFIGGPQVGDLFLNQVLLNVFLVIIRGPGTLHRDPGIRSGSRTMDQIWGLTEITPGAIAASPILVHFALSEDISLQPQGSVMKINYEADFHLYLKFFISGLAGGKKTVKKFFCVRNGFFFPSTPYSRSLGAALVTVIEDVFQALEDDFRSDNEEKLDAGGGLKHAPNLDGNPIPGAHPQHGAQSDRHASGATASVPRTSSREQPPDRLIEETIPSEAPAPSRPSRHHRGSTATAKSSVGSIHTSSNGEAHYEVEAAVSKTKKLRARVLGAVAGPSPNTVKEKLVKPRRAVVEGKTTSKDKGKTLRKV